MLSFSLSNDLPIDARRFAQSAGVAGVLTTAFYLPKPTLLAGFGDAPVGGGWLAFEHHRLEGYPDSFGNTEEADCRCSAECLEKCSRWP